MQAAYKQLKSTNPADVAEITKSLAQLTENHARARVDFKSAVEEFEKKYPGASAHKEIQAFQSKAARKAPPAHQPATAPAAPKSAPAPATQAPDPAPDAPKPSRGHLTHPPQKPPQEPSRFQRMRDWLKRDKPAKPAVASASDKEGWLNRLRSAVRREKPAVSMPSSSFSISEAAESSSLSTGGKVALGVGIAAVGGWAIYEATRKDTRKEASPYQGH